MLPVEEDVLLMKPGLSNFKDCPVDGNTSSVSHFAKAIHELENTFGLMPNVFAKGEASTMVADSLNRMQDVEDPINIKEMGIPQIDTLILIDREVDMVTPMRTQLTYEGLLDELLHVNNGTVEIDSSVMEIVPTKKIKVPLSCGDNVYREIRDLNFGLVAKFYMRRQYRWSRSTLSWEHPHRPYLVFVRKFPEVAKHTHLAGHLSSKLYLKTIVPQAGRH